MPPATLSAPPPARPIASWRTSLRRHGYFATVVAVHLILVALANEFAFMLRFDGATPSWASALQLRMLLWLLVIRGLTFIPFGVYRGVWRYASIWEMRNIAAGVVVSSGLFAIVTLVTGAGAYPRSIFIIDALLAGFLIAGVRLGARLHRGGALRLFSPRPTGDAVHRVLIYGAGEAGESIVREIQHTRSDYQAVGFI